MVLQRDPSGDGWRHTNSIEGVATRFARKRRLSDQAVRGMLDDIRLCAGGVSLHAITRTVGGEGWQYLANGEVSGDAAVKAEAGSDALSLVTLNVDGLGEYALSPADRMDAILTRVLLVEPDVLVLQAVTIPMLTQLRSRLPDWLVYRRSEVSECYFNVTVMRHRSERTTSCSLPASANGRHLVKTRWSGWTVLNAHAESGSHPVETHAREIQLLRLSVSHALEEHDQLCVIAGDLNLCVGEEGDLQGAGWRDARLSAPRLDASSCCRGVFPARHDCVFLHDALNGDSAECVQIRRLSGVWPALSDYVPLHAVVRRGPQASSPASSSVTGVFAAPLTVIDQASSTMCPERARPVCPRCVLCAPRS